MTCWLIYCPEDVAKNQAYIDLYRRECEAAEVDFVLLLAEDVKKILAEGGRLPEVAVNRSRDSALALALEQRGVAVYNSSLLSRIGNDKLSAYQYLTARGIPMLRTETSPEGLFFPMVVKTVDGHGGAEVFLVHTPEEYERIRTRMQGRRLICQEMATELGKDLRIYVVGNRIVGAMLRSSAQDFRANYSLGGKAELHVLTENERALAERVMRLLDIGHCGIDLLYHKGEPVLNELEDVVGSRMLYRYTEVDVVKLYMEHIFRTYRESL